MKKLFFLFTFLNLYYLSAISQIEFAGYTDYKNIHRKIFILDSIPKIQSEDTLSIISLDKIFFAKVIDINSASTNDSITDSQYNYSNLMFCADIIVFDSLVFFDSVWSVINLERVNGYKDLVKFFVFKSNEKIQSIKVDSCENFRSNNSFYNVKDNYIEIKWDDGSTERVKSNEFKYFCFKIFTNKWLNMTYIEIFWKEKAYFEELYHISESENKRLFYNCVSM